MPNEVRVSCKRNFFLKNNQYPAKGTEPFYVHIPGITKNMRRIEFDNVTINLLVAYIEGSADNSIKVKVEKWLEADAENKLFFNRLNEAWKNPQDLEALDTENIDNDWKIISEKLSEGNSSDKGGRFLSKYRWLWRAAAIILLLLSTGIGYFVGRGNNQPLSFTDKGYHLLVVPQGQRSELKLSDGSRVWVNAGSTIRFPNAFNNTSRDVWLDGEAYFEVTHDKNKPFLVHTSDLDVKVHGTKFNVKAYSAENVIEATLIEGSVSVQSHNLFSLNSPEVYLQPNHKAIYFKKKPEIKDVEIAREVTEPLQIKKIIITKPVQVEPAISWREGKLVFVDETFENIAVKLERRFGVTIKIESDQLKKIKYTGVLKNISIEQALKAIQLSANFGYTINENTIVISQKGTY
jgi:transmembrane sensor